MAQSNFFSPSGVRRVLHTPITYRSRRQLFSTPFTPAPAPNTPLPPDDDSNPGPPGVDAPATVPPPAPVPPPQFVLSWDTASKATPLYKTLSPLLKYSPASRDEDTNKIFLKEMDMYFNFQVRSWIVGVRPHPFSSYARLKEYFQARGQQDFQFDTTKTFATLEIVKQNDDVDFHHDLLELLCGSVVSRATVT